MAKGDGERGREIRFSCNVGATSGEGMLLYRALSEAVEDRRASELLRVIALRGWLDLIHGVSPKERLRTLRSIGISEEIIEKIDVLWPRPLMHESDEGPMNMARLIQAAQVLSQAPERVSHVAAAPTGRAMPSEPAPPPPAALASPPMVASAPAPVAAPVAEVPAQQPGSDTQSNVKQITPSKSLSRLGGSLGLM